MYLLFWLSLFSNVYRGLVVMSWGGGGGEMIHLYIRCCRWFCCFVSTQRDEKQKKRVNVCVIFCFLLFFCFWFLLLLSACCCLSIWPRGDEWGAFLFVSIYPSIQKQQHNISLHPKTTTQYKNKTTQQIWAPKLCASVF